MPTENELDFPGDDAVAAMNAAMNAGQGTAAVRKLIGRVGGDRGHPLLELLRTTLLPASRPRFKRAFADLRAGEPAVALAENLARLGLQEAALVLIDLSSERGDPLAAELAARWHLQRGAYGEAMRAADMVIATMLRRPMAIDRFMLACSRTARPQQLLRYRPGELLQLAHLRRALLTRWEALHRQGDYPRAQLMETGCQCLFPQQRSLRVVAGNHALDRNELHMARGHFAAALALDPQEVSALAGLAIAAEMDKDWDTALQLRQQAAELSAAFAGDDIGSLHRVLRYAAALGRLGRWAEAKPWFRQSVRRSAFQKLPEERPVLLRVFSGPLYSPATLQAMLENHGENHGENHNNNRGAPAVPALQTRAVSLAMGDAVIVANLPTVGFPEAPESDAAQQQASAWLSAAMREWELGDPATTYEYANRADAPGAPGGGREIAAHYLLLRSAQEIHANDLNTIQTYALSCARATLRSAAPSEEARLYAQLTLHQLTRDEVDLERLDGPGGQLFALIQRCRDSPDLALALLHAAPRALLIGARPAWQPAIGPLRAFVLLRELCGLAAVPPERLALACGRIHLALFADALSAADPPP